MGGMRGAARRTTSVIGPGARVGDRNMLEHRALHQDQPFALVDGRRRHLQQVDAPPVREADGNDEDQPRRLDQSAQHVDPHRFANAAEYNAGEHEQEAEREPP